MAYDSKKIAGLLLFVGGVQCFLGIIVAETLYPGYSTSQNWISDLGVGPSALIFNSSVFLLGLIGFAMAAIYIHRIFKSRLFSALVAMAAIGAMGVGVFTEDFGVLHTIFSVIVFTFAGISAIASYKFQRAPLSYVSVVLGLTSILALVLTALGIDLGLGQGGMERMIAYPSLLWVVGFGAFLIGDSDSTSGKNKSKF